MSKRSESRSTILPLPSSPHWAPRMMILLMAKPIHSTACDNLGFYGAFRSLLEARGERIRTTDSVHRHWEAENLPALRCIQSQRAHDQAQYRSAAEAHSPVLGAPVRGGPGVRQGSGANRAGIAPGHDRGGAGLSGDAARRRLLQQGHQRQELFDGRLGREGI